MKVCPIPKWNPLNRAYIRISIIISIYFWLPPNSVIPDYDLGDPPWLPGSLSTGIRTHVQGLLMECHLFLNGLVAQSWVLGLGKSQYRESGEFIPFKCLICISF